MCGLYNNFTKKLFYKDSALCEIFSNKTPDVYWKENNVLWNYSAPSFVHKIFLATFEKEATIIYKVIYFERAFASQFESTMGNKSIDTQWRKYEKKMCNILCTFFLPNKF